MRGGALEAQRGNKRKEGRVERMQREGANTQSDENDNNNNNNNKDSTNLAFLFPKQNVSWSRAEGINLLKNKCRVRRQAVIKVLTDQSASDSEPAIILTESNEHSKPCSAPNMKGDVICWQLASRRGNRRGERNGGRGEERERELGVTGGEKGSEEKEECLGRQSLAAPWGLGPSSSATTATTGARPKSQVQLSPPPTHPQDLQRPHFLKEQEGTQAMEAEAWVGLPG